jgi:hypothetical protein
MHSFRRCTLNKIRELPAPLSKLWPQEGVLASAPDLTSLRNETPVTALGFAVGRVNQHIGIVPAVRKVIDYNEITNGRLQILLPVKVDSVVINYQNVAGSVAKRRMGLRGVVQ